MAAESPNSATVGQINVGVRADLSGLKSDLAKAETEVKASAQRAAAAAVVPIGNKSAAARAAMGAADGFGMGKGPGISSIGGGSAANTATVAAGVATVSEEIGRAETRARGLFSTLGNIRRVVSRLFLPALLISQVTRMAKAFEELRQSAEQFDKALRATAAGPAQELLKTLREVRAAQDLLTRGQIEDLDTRERGRQIELALNEVYQQRIIHLHTVAGLLEAMSSGKRSVTLLAEAEREYNQQLELTRKQTEELVRLQAKLRAHMEEQERIQRRMREQSKRDITHTTIDASRLGPALDLLQRQRTGA